MTKRYTLEEIRTMNPMPDISKMSTAEKVSHISKSLERSRQRMEEQSRMLAWLRRRMDPHVPREPIPDLRTWQELNAYVDRIAKGASDVPD